MKPAPLVYETSKVDRLLSIALRKISELEHEVREMRVKRLVEENQIDINVLDENGLLPPPIRKTKRGRGYRPILQSEIEDAQAKADTAMGAARLLGISYPLFRKYAKLYGIHRINPSAKRMPNYFSPEKGRYPLSEILENKHTHLNDYVVRAKLIRSNLLDIKCNICGYDHRRSVDNKICLLLDHKDGDKKNFKLDNLQLLCLNCTFECGRGYIRAGKKLFDPDWIEGSTVQYADTNTRY